MAELTELYEVAEWAVYHGYREISAKTLGEIMAKGGTIGRDSLLEKRLSFDGYIYSVNHEAEGRPSKLTDSLKFLDELQQSFLKDCRSDATNEYRWLRIRQLTIMQLAILKLKDLLRMDPVHLLPNKPTDIVIPKSFQPDEFRREAAQLFTKHKKYTSSTVLGKIEDQSADLFLEILMTPFNTERVKYALHFLLNMHPIETFRFEATTFAKTVEREVLPSPHHFYYPPQSAVNSTLPTTTSTEQIWDEQNREVNGPYAAAEAAGSQKLKKRQQSEPSPPPPPPPPEDIDTDEQSGSPEEFKNGKKSHKYPDNAALRNLREKKTSFQETNSKHDPLFEAVGITKPQTAQSHKDHPLPEALEIINVPPVQSRAGGNARKTRSMTAQDNHTPTKKSRLIDSRNSTSEVVWTESEDDLSEQEGKSNKLTVQNVKKKKFDQQLSKPTPSPSTHSPRDKSVRLGWTKDEEEALLAGVSLHGVGNWVAILQDSNLSYRFRGRTNVNLKDKYRNLTAS